MIWDFDSTLLNVHSEKEDAAATYKHGFGFNPIAVWCDNTNETLAAMLRPGNAAPGNTDDHLEVLEQAVRAVPAEYALGHEEGDESSLVLHQSPGPGRLGRGHAPLLPRCRTSQKPTSEITSDRLSFHQRF